MNTTTPPTTTAVRPPHHPVAAKFPLLEGDEALELRADLQAHGLREPIVLDAPLAEGGRILDGRNRERQCILAGVPVRYEVFRGPDPIGYIISKNIKRRHLTASQRALLGAELIPLYEAEAEERKQKALREANLRRAVRARPDKEAPTEAKLEVEGAPSAETPTADAGRARDKAAAAVGASPRSVERARVVAEQGAPELRDAVQAGTVTVGAAAELATLPKEEQARLLASADPKALEAAAAEQRRAKETARRQEREERIRSQAAGNLPLDAGAGRYAVAYIDPPWRYDAPISDTRKIENQYPTMTVEDICALPVPNILTDDAVVFMWVPAPMDCDGTGQRVVDAWGLRVVAKVVWVKDERALVEERGEASRRGMGRWTRVDHELLYMAVRGEPPTPEPAVRASSVLFEPRGKHSAKPERAAQRIELMYPNLPRVELFARVQRPGWAVWGNESTAEVAA